MSDADCRGDVNARRRQHSAARAVGTTTVERVSCTESPWIFRLRTPALRPAAGPFAVVRHRGRTQLDSDDDGRRVKSPRRAHTLRGRRSERGQDRCGRAFARYNIIILLLLLLLYCHFNIVVRACARYPSDARVTHRRTRIPTFFGSPPHGHTRPNEHARARTP